MEIRLTLLLNAEDNEAVRDQVVARANEFTQSLIHSGLVNAAICDDQVAEPA
jgi:hypothetical protein